MQRRAGLRRHPEGPVGSHGHQPRHRPLRGRQRRSGGDAAPPSRRHPAAARQGSEARQRPQPARSGRATRRFARRCSCCATSGGGSPPTSNGKSTAIASRPCASASITAGKLLNRKRLMRTKEKAMQSCPRLRHRCAPVPTDRRGLAESGACPGLAAAQQDAGTLRVLVQDSTGVVPGAEVVVTNDATNVATTQVSNAQGYATFSPIPARHLHGGRDADRLQSRARQQRHDRGQPEPPAAGDAGPGDHRGNDRSGGASRRHPDRGCDARSGAEERGHRAAAACRPPLHRPGAAHPGRHREHRRPQPARTGLARRQRQLARDEQLPARRLRQQPEHAEHAVAFGAGGVAVAGYARRVQGHHQRLLGRVRPCRRRRDQRVDQVGHQSIPRVGLDLQPQRVARREPLGE